MAIETGDPRNQRMLHDLFGPDSNLVPLREGHILARARAPASLRSTFNFDPVGDALRFDRQAVVRRLAGRAFPQDIKRSSRYAAAASGASHRLSGRSRQRRLADFGMTPFAPNIYNPGGGDTGGDDDLEWLYDMKSEHFKQEPGVKEEPDIKKEAQGSDDTLAQVINQQPSLREDAAQHHTFVDEPRLYTGEFSNQGEGAGSILGDAVAAGGTAGAAQAAASFGVDLDGGLDGLVETGKSLIAETVAAAEEVTGGREEFDPRSVPKQPPTGVPTSTSRVPETTTVQELQMADMTDLDHDYRDRLVSAPRTSTPNHRTVVQPPAAPQPILPRVTKDHRRADWISKDDETARMRDAQRLATTQRQTAARRKELSDRRGNTLANPVVERHPLAPTYEYVPPAEPAPRVIVKSEDPQPAQRRYGSFAISRKATAAKPAWKPPGAGRGF